MGVYIPGQQFATQGPCPSGFHIPLRSEWDTLKNIFTGLGLSLGGDFIAYFKLPPAGRREYNSGDVYQQNSQCRYWGSEKSHLNSNYANGLNINGNTINSGGSPYRAYGCSIRAFSNTSVIPDSNWSVLYQGTGTAGVYHNSSLGLISASSDGTTWVTIADKNLGATEVYNYLDNLSESNCGGYFQWGNNYMFPFSGSVTTSSTKVDATNYGPNNYYNSSTFITSSTSPQDWSSVRNSNLWGGEDGNVNVLRMEELKNAYIGELLPTSITLDKSSISLTTVGKTEQLTATVEPEDAPRKTVTWSSDDTTVATVSSSGLVTCVTPGECTITATTVNGLTASCSVGGGWQPGINTVLYVPLNGDVVDYSSYNRSFTVYGSSASVGTPVFDTLASGKKVANFIATGSSYSNWIAFTDNVTDIPSSGNMTVSLWMNRSSNGNRYMGIVDYRDNSRYTWMTGIHQNNRFLFHGISQETSTFIPTVGTWYNMICIVDNGTCYIYKDGVQIYSDSYTYNSPSQKVCLGGFYNSGATNAREEAFNGKLGDVIVENKARTAQEIADYYDLTKSLYGIS